MVVRGFHILTNGVLFSGVRSHNPPPSGYNVGSISVSDIIYNNPDPPLVDIVFFEFSLKIFKTYQLKCFVLFPNLPVILQGYKGTKIIFSLYLLVEDVACLYGSFLLIFFFFSYPFCMHFSSLSSCISLS